MKTKFRIGYPYAHSESEIRPSMVVLTSSPFGQGYQSIFVNKKLHYLPKQVKGPEVLAHITKKSVIGKLYETQDKRFSIARGGEIHGAGPSMQLALALAVFADGEENENLPLLLFSGKIERPVTAPEFIDAKIEVYDEDVSWHRDSLLKKYEVAKIFDAFAFVMPKKDAVILTRELHKKEGIDRQTYSINILDELSDQELKTPVLIGVSCDALPQLARKMGISSYYYIERKKNTFAFAGIILFFIAAVYMGKYLADSKNNDIVSIIWEDQYRANVHKRLKKKLGYVVLVKPFEGKSGRIVYYNLQRKKLWEYVPNYKDAPYYKNRFLVVEYFIEDIQVDKKSFLRIAISHGSWFGRSKVEFFSYKKSVPEIGKPLGAFWHRGMLSYLDIKKIANKYFIFFVGDWNLAKWGTLDNPHYSSGIMCVPLQPLLKKKGLLHVSWPGIKGYPTLKPLWLTLFPPSPIIETSPRLALEQILNEYLGGKNIMIFFRDSRSYNINLINGKCLSLDASNDYLATYPQYFLKGEKAHLLLARQIIQEGKPIAKSYKLVKKNKKEYVLVYKKKKTK